MRRLVHLARAARNQGKPNFAIGSLVFEVSHLSKKQKLSEENHNQPETWLNTVINLLPMQSLISDDFLEDLGKKLEQIKETTVKNCKIYDILKQEFQQTNLDEILKDKEMLVKIYKILRSHDTVGFMKELDFKSAE